MNSIKQFFILLASLSVFASAASPQAVSKVTLNDLLRDQGGIGQAGGHFSTGSSSSTSTHVPELVNPEIAICNAKPSYYTYGGCPNLDKYRVDYYWHEGSNSCKTRTSYVSSGSGCK